MNHSKSITNYSVTVATCVSIHNIVIASYWLRYIVRIMIMHTVDMHCAIINVYILSSLIVVGVAAIFFRRGIKVTILNSAFLHSPGKQFGMHSLTSYLPKDGTS